MEWVDYICYALVAGAIYYFMLRLGAKKPKTHNWYEVGSSDIANPERKRKKGR